MASWPLPDVWHWLYPQVRPCGTIAGITGNYLLALFARMLGETDITLGMVAFASVFCVVLIGLLWGLYLSWDWLKSEGIRK